MNKDDIEDIPLRLWWTDARKTRQRFPHFASEEEIEDTPHKTGRPLSGRTCEAFGCLEETKNSKPYCLKHIAMNSYAAKVLSEQNQWNDGPESSVEEIEW